VKFLEQLEQDLQVVAEQEVARKPAPSRRGIRWKSWLGAAASIIVLAFAIGALAQLHDGSTQASGGGSFSSVGLAPVPPNNAHAAQGTDGSIQQRYGGESGNQAAAGAATDLTKIIRDGTIALAVPDGSFDSKQGQVVAIAHANGGFVLSSQTQAATTGTLTIRIPADRFDAAIAQIGKLGTVESSTVTGKDVTNQYLDYKAHLRNLIGRRTVLRHLLAQTTTIGESLTVYNDLNDVQLQIDQIHGQLRYLNNQVDESTLTVDLREDSAPAGETETNGAIHNPSLSRAWDRAIQGFFGIIATIIVGLGYLIPLVVIAAVVYAIITLVRRRGRAAS
jgi:hypothetical protein